jgi:hypothetical protein
MYVWYQRYTQITHHPLLFRVVQEKSCTERLSRSTVHYIYKSGERGVCTLVLCSLATVTSCIDLSVRIVTNPRRWDIYLYSPSFWVVPTFLMASRTELRLCGLSSTVSPT